MNSCNYDLQGKIPCHLVDNKHPSQCLGVNSLFPVRHTTDYGNFENALHNEFVRKWKCSLEVNAFCMIYAF
jgi:hypothetical protein